MKNNVSQSIENIFDDVKKEGRAVVVTDKGVAPEIRSAIKRSAEARNSEMYVMDSPRDAFEERFYDEKIAPEDVNTVIYFGSSSMTHRKETVRAIQDKKRVVSSTNTTYDLLNNPALSEDAKKVGERFDSLEGCLSSKSVKGFKISSQNGTDVYVGVEAKAYDDDGRGLFVQIPYGERAYHVVPEETEGVIVADGNIAGIDKPQYEQVRLKVNKGRIVNVNGGEAAEKLSHILEKEQEKYKQNNPEGKSDVYRIVELGLGMNGNASAYDKYVVVAEKALGRVHFGFGNDTVFKGNNDIRYHNDVGVADPTTKVEAYMNDGSIARIIENGKYLTNGGN